MRLTNYTLTSGLIRQMQQLGTAQSKLQTQVATGQKISQPEDAPAAVARVLRLESEQRQVAQFGKNAERATEVSQATYSGLQQLKQLMDRATEIGTLATGPASAQSQQAYGAEINQLLEEAVQVANSKFGSDYLYGGTQTGAAPFAVTRDASGQVTGATFVGNTQRAAIQVSETSSVTPGTSAETNATIGTLVNQLRAMRDALGASDSSAVSGAQQALLGTEDKVVSALAEHGAIETRIEAAKAEQSTQSTNLEAMISSETDIDMPTAIMKLSQTQTAYQAALQSSAKIMGLSLLDYLQ